MSDIKQFGHNELVSTLQTYGINFKRADDAAAIQVVDVEDILNGTLAMPFGHVHFLELALLELGLPQLAKKANLQHRAAICRNTRIIKAVNEIIKQEISKGKELTLKIIDSEMETIFSNIDTIYKDADALGVSIDCYLKSDLADDIMQCSNDWNLDQNRTIINTADLIPLIKLNNKIYLAAITRAFGPGKNNTAFSGGIVEDNETHQQAAEREGKEEMNFEEVKSLKTKRKFNVGPIESNSWDPRAKFPLGVRVQGTVIYIDLDSIITK